MLKALHAPSPAAWLARAALVSLALVTVWTAFIRARADGALLGKDEIDHVVFVAGLTLFTGLSFPRVPVRTVGLVWCVPAFSFEFVQAVVSPGREASVRDVLTSLLGVLVGAMVLGYFRIAAAPR